MKLNKPNKPDQPKKPKSAKKDTIFTDIFGNKIRLTDERKMHILEHKEMINQLELIKDTLKLPEKIVESKYEKEVRLYYKFYSKTPVTEKYLIVIVRLTSDDNFILTSFFTDKIKKGRILWEN